MKINLKSCKPQWEKFSEGIELLIAPYPNSMSNTRFVVEKGTARGQMVLEGEDQKKAFLFCLRDQRGTDEFADDNGKRLDFSNDEVKGTIFDFEWKLQTGIPAFVLEKSGMLRKVQEEEEKNLEIGDSGTGTKII